MSPVRTFVSVTLALLAVSGLVGCYDLSDPSGPHPDDFVRARDATESTEETQEQDQTEARATTTTDTTALLVLGDSVMDDGHPASEAKRAIRPLPGDAD